MKKSISIVLTASMLLSSIAPAASLAEENAGGEAVEEKIDNSNIKKDNFSQYSSSDYGNTDYNTVVGDNRYDTSVKVSRSAFSRSKYAIIVNGQKYPDSISSIPVAAKFKAPILLTEGKELENSIKDELKRLNTQVVYIVGGRVSVSRNIEEALRQEKIEVIRLKGDNRYKTNREVVDTIFKDGFKKGIFVSGENFADAISVGGLSYRYNLPIILMSEIDEQNDYGFINGKNIKESMVVGGVKAISDNLMSRIPNAKRYSGLNRYETSYVIHREFFPSDKAITLTTGDNFADALSGVPYASQRESNLVLYNRNPRTFPNIEAYNTVNVLGGSLVGKMRNIVQEKILYNKDYIKYADLLMKNYIAKDADNGDIVQFKGNYADFEKENRTDQRRIYGFFFLNDLVNAYADTGNRDYIRKGMEYIRAFEKDNPFDKESMRWHDETVARRLKHYLIFYKEGYNALTAADLDMLKIKMGEMANKIAYTDFWAGINNHGMFQDLALLGYSDEFKEHAMYRLAARRLETYFESCFDSDGVHLENSPEYHFAILGELKHVLDKVDKSEFADYKALYSTYKKSERFSRAIIMPDGYLPNIGDTKTEKIDLTKYYDGDRYSEDNYGRNTFYKAGYDIMKTRKSFLLLRAGFANPVHHHDDDLSIWLNNGGNIITEVGSFGYEHSNPYTGYARSFEAHNNLVVDDKNKASGMDVHLNETEESNTMSGETKRIEGVDFARKVRYNEDISFVSIEDSIKSTDGEEHEYTLRFHLDPSITAKVEKDFNAPTQKIIKLYRKDTYIGKLYTDKGRISLIDDVYFPYYYSNPEKTKVIRIRVSGKDVNVNTKIELEK